MPVRVRTLVSVCSLNSYLRIHSLINKGFKVVSIPSSIRVPRHDDILAPPLHHNITHQAVTKIEEFSQMFNPEGKRSDAKEGQVLPGYGPGDFAIDAGKSSTRGGHSFGYNRRIN